MDITKCDICKRIKNERSNRGDKWIKGHVWGEDFLHFDLCEKCSTKLIVYLNKYLKIKKEK